MRLRGDLEGDAILGRGGGSLGLDCLRSGVHFLSLSTVMNRGAVDDISLHPSYFGYGQRISRDNLKIEEFCFV